MFNFFPPPFSFFTYLIFALVSTDKARRILSAAVELLFARRLHQSAQPSWSEIKRKICPAKVMFLPFLAVSVFFINFCITNTSYEYRFDVASRAQYQLYRRCKISFCLRKQRKTIMSAVSSCRLHTALLWLIRVGSE